jgi:hypothetical protein
MSWFSAMATARDFWEELFPDKDAQGQGVRTEMRLLRKRGRPFLLLPGASGPAAECLSLYPAQTGRARLARKLMCWALRSSLPFGAQKVAVEIPPSHPWVEFLSGHANGPKGTVPTFGVLAGNPASEGQRFLILLFDEQGRPVVVVKAGFGVSARNLVETEQKFLSALPNQAQGVPKLRGTFQNSHLSALALDFQPGDSPQPRNYIALPPLLTSWIAEAHNVPLGGLPDWLRLEQAAAGSDWFAPLAEQLRAHMVHPAIYHGDFAPWNIKVSPRGDWIVLDWERGELSGIPGWDWFHYVLQPAILVEHLDTSHLVRRAEALLASNEFQTYAKRASIVGMESQLLVAYLLHCVAVIKPSEGGGQTQNLLDAFRKTLLVR